MDTTSSTPYLADLVSNRLAERGMIVDVTIRPRAPITRRLETGERTQFVVQSDGALTAELVLDEWEIAGGTVGASVVDAIADRIAKVRARDMAA
jgi:hypothetical protein